MLQAGRQILVEEGLGVGAETLTFKKVFARVERERGIRITNASVIGRVWTNQDEFRADVVAQAASKMLKADEEYLVSEYQRVAMEAHEAVGAYPVDTEESRTARMLEMIRHSSTTGMGDSNDLHHTMLRTVVWMMAAFSGGESPSNEELVASLRAGYVSALDRHEELIRLAAASIGFRLRPGMTFRAFTQAQIALVEGNVVRRGVFGQLPPAFLPTGPEGSDQEWSIVALGIRALTQQFFELDPEFQP